jgi:hypothetical protein
MVRAYSVVKAQYGRPDKGSVTIQGQNSPAYKARGTGKLARSVIFTLRPFGTSVSVDSAR